MMATSLPGVLLLGFLVGLRHCLEPDHLAAVASLPAGRGGLGASVRRGIGWGLGHSLSVWVVGGAVLLLGIAPPQRLSDWAEMGVGAVLVLLGLDVFRRMRRERIHVHAHAHGEVVHLHAHRHQAVPAAHAEPGAHDHAHGLPVRAVAVGALHGLAGSAALVLLMVASVGSVRLGLAYLALFGIGSVAGMVLLSVALAVPLRASARVAEGAYRALEGLTGVAAVALGLWTLLAR